MVSASVSGIVARIRKDPAKTLPTLHVEQLAHVLQKASDAYYNQGEPLLSDDLFDMAKEALQTRAPEHPLLAQVGAPIAIGDKVKLPYWMGSLDKIRDDPKSLDKWCKQYEGNVVVSEKLDGNSAMLDLSRPSHPKLYSRGDGEYGQNVSHLLPHLTHLPNLASIPAGWVIRGELIIPRRAWKEIEGLGANARNVVAGAMHRKEKHNPEILARVRFVAYEVLHPKFLPSEGLAEIARRGFEVVPHHILPTNKVTMESLSELLQNHRTRSAYEIDGIVIAHNGFHTAVHGKNPKHAFAFKSLLTHEEAEVVVSGVEWNVSKDGYMKPTILFTPTRLAGVTLRRATGFHGSFIEKNKIGPGARIVVIRSGDVIPRVMQVLVPAEQAAMPDFPYEWNETHVEIRVPKQATDDTETTHPQQQLRALEHFATTLDIEYLGPGTLKKLVQAGWDTVPKLFKATLQDFLSLDGFQEASAGRLHAALQKVRTTATCVEMMAASNLFGRGMGKKRLEPITRAFPKVLSGVLPSREELLGVEGIGPAGATLFLEGLPRFFRWMEELGMSCTSRNATSPRTTSPHGTSSHTHTTPDVTALASLHVVFTGFRNKPWEHAIETAGGQVHTTVNKKVRLVVASTPDDASSKLEKARELDIPIVSKEVFASEYQLP